MSHYAYGVTQRSLCECSIGEDHMKEIDMAKDRGGVFPTSSKAQITYPPAPAPQAGGKPSKGTPKDSRLKENKTKAK